MAWVKGLAALLLLTVLSGCSGDASNKGDVAEDEDFDDLDLDATEDTGIIRGVVLDEAIVPLAGVAVRATGTGGSPLETETTDVGTFGFDELEPGIYFLSASKPGYISGQLSVEVVAGEDEPEIQKIVLAADPVSAPFAQGYVFDGFIECSVSIIAVGFAACSSVGALNDRFIVQYTPQRVPDWAQTEMIWDSTQQVNDGLALLYSGTREGQALLYNYGDQRGPSPLLVTANQTTLEEFGVGNGTDLVIRVFNHPIEGTTPPDPVNGDDCLDRPALGGCATGIGFTIEQDFTHYTHIFYGYTPQPDWLFSVDGEPVPP
jgi:hypothetical protein